MTKAFYDLRDERMINMRNEKLNEAINTAKETTKKAVDEISKAAEPVIETAKATAKEVGKKAEPAVKKAKSAVKSAAKKAEPAIKNAVDTAKDVSKKAAAAINSEVYLQFRGSEYDVTDLIERCKADYKKTNKSAIRSCKVYVKPEDGMAYYVINDIAGKVSL